LRLRRVWSRGLRGWWEKEQVALDDGGGDVGEFVSGVLGVVAEHRECLVGVDRVLVHQDALCLFDHGAASEGSLQAVVFGEALQRDVDRALQLFGEWCRRCRRRRRVWRLRGRRVPREGI
jgi:hypothetical protein